MARCARPLRSTQELQVSGACTTHAALPASRVSQPTEHHSAQALFDASANTMHLHAARGPPWRARVRPAGALGRPNQQEQHPKGPQATAQPEDRAGHPGFAAPQTGFYVAYT